MGKVHVEAILEALKQTVESLTVDGICNRNKIITKSVDEQYVQDLEDGYSDKIQDIIDNIPDVPPTPPGPTLPTVQNIQCWFNQNQGSASVPASFTRLVYDANNSRIPYSSSLLYCVFLIDASETPDGTFEVVKSTNDNLAISRSNGTNYTTVYTVFYASCSDKTATIIDVYDSQNKAFKAFKYTLDGVDYYRVMEWQNTHPDWVSDLSSIGYHLPVQLPGVEISNSFDGTTSNWLYASDQVIETLAPNATFEPYVEGGYSTYRNALYDTSKSYAVLFINIDTQATRGNPTTVQIVKSDTVIAWKNVTGASISVFATKVAVCSSNQASVATVYDAQSNTFNAFKFTVDGTDYYYVLDGVQTDWTEDLSSIGYTLTPVFPTVSITGDISVGNWVYPVGGEASLASNATVTVKDDFSSGSTIAFNTNVCYAVRNWYTDSSNTGANGSISVANVSNNLCVKNDTNSTLNFYAARIGVCYNNQATVVTVYNSQNNPYNAFQYTLNGTDYYYVLDGTQTDWADDLSSIGYSLIPALPTVTKQQMKYVPWGSPGVTFLNGQSRALYYNGSTVSYNNNVLYSVRANSTNSQTEPDYYYNHAFTVISFNGTIGIFNGSGGDIYTEGCYLYTCVSNSSSLVTVYNANNAEYYAFKYTTNGTDYYYVLDGTQDDWTNDLSSIGYSLYLKLTVLDGTQDRYCGPGSISYLYLNGNSGGIVWVSGKYTLISVYTLDGNRSPYTFSFGTANGLMTLTSSSSSAVACYCYVQVS